MNFFLKFNRKIILLFILFLLTLFILVFLTKNNQIKKFNNINQLETSESLYDITFPKFTINNKQDKISVTAKGGNFLNKNEILLEKNVLFQSKKFKILSNNVIFDRENQTAKSMHDSIFVSKATTIKSEGFNMQNKGDIIIFNGKTSLTISK